MSSQNRSTSDRQRCVAFVSVTGGLGGPSRSLATVLPHMAGSFDRVLMAPSGTFTDVVRNRGSIEQYIRLPRWRRARRFSRLVAALRIALWAMRHRRLVLAIHANGQAELNLVAPAAIVAKVPIVVWAHASDASPSVLKLARLWRRWLRRVTWAAVSPEAHQVLLYAGLVSASTLVKQVPNPVDPTEVVTDSPLAHAGVNIAFLKGKVATGGFHLLPETISALSDLSVRWLIFTSAPKEAGSPEQHSTWRDLQSLGRGRVEFRGKIPKVDLAYAESDIVFCPSLRESFGRVAAEAMLNGIPVVASDIPPLRRLVGDEEAGLLFPPGDPQAAASQIRRLVEDPDLRSRLGQEGHNRAAEFLPERVVKQLCDLYGSPGGQP